MSESIPSLEPASQKDLFRLISTTTAEHYIWGDKCDGWFLLKATDIHVIQERMPPGAAEIMHYHRNSRQLFYVLHGELTMRSPSGSTKVLAGHAITVDPLTRHQAANESVVSVEFLVVSCPPAHGDRVSCE